MLGARRADGEGQSRVELHICMGGKGLVLEEKPEQS